MVDTLHIAKIRQITGAADFIEDLGFAEAKVGSFSPRLKLVLFAGRQWDLTVFLRLLLSPGPEGVPGVPMCFGTYGRALGCPHTPGYPGSLGMTHQGLPTLNLRFLLTSWPIRPENGGFGWF